MTETKDTGASSPRAGELTMICPECGRTGSHVAIGRLGELRAIGYGEVGCLSCGSSYPVICGIPVLIPEEYRSPLSSPGEEEDRCTEVHRLPVRKTGKMVELLSGSISLNVGCGNGSYATCFNGDVVLTDTNFCLVEEALEQHTGPHEAFGVVSDARFLPFQPDCFGYVLCASDMGLTGTDVSLALQSMKEVTAGTLQIDVLKNGAMLELARRFTARGGLFNEVLRRNHGVPQDSTLTLEDLSGGGFEAHGYLHWAFRERFKLGRLWDIYDAVVWRFPSMGGRLAALNTKTEPGPGSSLKSGFWRGDRSMVELWNETGASYDNRWQSTASKALSTLELDYVRRYCERSSGGTVLDIGVGTGRILECLAKQDNTENLYGIDLSEEMAKHCRNGVRSGKLKEIAVLDVSVEDIPFDAEFDFITAVRVLPYCDNWEEVLSDIIARLKPGGILVFSMPNRRSINRITPCPVPVQWATMGQIEQLALDNGVELLAIESFTRLPDVFYHLARGGFSAKALLAVEGWFRKILGRTLLGRFLFVAVRKPAGGSTL